MPVQKATDSILMVNMAKQHKWEPEKSLNHYSNLEQETMCHGCLTHIRSLDGESGLGLLREKA